MKLHNVFTTSCLALTLLLVSPAEAQDPKDAETVAVAVPIPVVDKGPEDALNRGNPRDSILGYLDAASSFKWEIAAEYLDLRQLPPEVEEVGGHELARQFNQILSRSVWLDDYSISSNPEGLKGDNLPGYRDELVRIKTQNGEVPIWMQRIPRGDGEQIWKVSNRSVALIPELYDEFSYPAPVEKIRGWFPEDASFLGFEAFKWAIILAVALISWPFYWLLGLLLSRIFSSPAKQIYPLVRRLFTGPMVFIAILLTLGHITARLGAGAYAQQVMDANTLNTLALVWMSWALINLIKTVQQNKLMASGRPGAAKLMQPLSTLAKLLIFIFGLLFWLNNLGVNITTVLAGLGVGGLAVALALQKPIEDMMGALSIFSQAPIRVGDFVRYGTERGVVEDIGLRTTRLRTLTNTVVSIPNARIAAIEVENISYRTKIRYWPTLRLRYDTSQEQLQTITTEIKAMLEEEERVYEDPVRVRFTDFADDAVLIKIHCFIKTTDYSEFLEVAEDLNLRIMGIVDSAGTSFALPSRNIRMEGEAGIAP